MALIQITDLTFAYDGSYDNVFEHLSAQVDTAWRLGLTGRNGRGKTTLLHLLSGQEDARGRVHMPVKPLYFPFAVADPSQTTRAVVSQLMGEEEEWRLLCELAELEVASDALERPFDTLSHGEQTKVLLAALFARDAVYPLIDEPTNHLDLHGRQLVGDYLRRKDGFLLVSHDRDFLNRAVDHILALNRSDVRVCRGNYDTYEENLRRQNAYETERNKQLGRDIRRLEESVRRAAEWSAKAEGAKFHIAPSVAAVVDRGYVGAKAARVMQKSKNLMRRRQDELDEKRSLMKNVEKVGELRLSPLSYPKPRLIEVRGAAVRYGERIVCAPVTFSVLRGERVALTGKNGAGKSSVLKALCGQSDALCGDVEVGSGLKLSIVPQDTSFLTGSLAAFIAGTGVDETLFKAILRNMDMKREQFDKDMRAFSAGQKKKVLLARSLCESAHLYVWDEPLNYIDVLSREQLEELITAFQPTMLLVEHDRRFLQNIDCKVVELGENRG